MSMGALLLDSGKLNPEDAERVLRMQKETGIRFGEAAVRLGLVSEDDIQDAIFGIDRKTPRALESSSSKPTPKPEVRNQKPEQNQNPQKQNPKAPAHASLSGFALSTF